MSETPLAEESGCPKVSADTITDSGIPATAAYKALISFYNSSMSPWHGQALGDELGMLGTGAGTEIQFPFPSLKYPAAHETGTLDGIHPPAPSEVWPYGHLGGDEI
jgi:hypothetical protein